MVRWRILPFNQRILQKVKQFCFNHVDGKIVPLVKRPPPNSAEKWDALLYRQGKEDKSQILSREQKKHEYHEAVKNRYKHLPEVKRVVRHRHSPKPIYKAMGIIRTVNESKRRKEARRKAHSAPGTVVTKPLRQRRIIKEVE